MAKQKLARQLIAFLGPPVIKLDDYCPFQDFHCYNGAMRSCADDLVEALEEILKGAPSPQVCATFLIWGDSGVGKTFLVKQAYKEVFARIKKKVEFQVVPLHKLDTEKKLSKALDAIQALTRGKRRVLAFVDEVDAWPPKTYRQLHEASEWNLMGRHIAWVFAGSHGRNMTEMVTWIRGAPKGKDLLSRIQVKISLPRLEAQDKIVVAASTACAKGVLRIDKAALLAIGLNEEIDSSRRVQQTIEAAIQQSNNRKVLRYQSVFASQAAAITFLDDYPAIKQVAKDNVAVTIRRK